MKLVRQGGHPDNSDGGPMSRIEQVHRCSVQGAAANFDLDLGDESAVWLELKHRLDPIRLGLRAIDLAGVGTVRKPIDIVAWPLFRTLLILVAFRIRREFDRNAIVSVGHRMHSSSERRHGIAGRKDYRVVVIHGRERLLNDNRYGTFGYQKISELIELGFRHSCSFRASREKTSSHTRPHERAW